MSKILLYCTKAKPYLYRQDDDCFELLNKLKLDNLIEHDYKVEEISIIKKELKAFEIMKKNLGASFDCLKYYETVQEWNEEYGDNYFLTNEEFVLLQEVLNEN